MGNFVVSFVMASVASFFFRLATLEIVLSSGLTEKLANTLYSLVLVLATLLLTTMYCAMDILKILKEKEGKAGKI